MPPATPLDIIVADRESVEAGLLVRSAWAIVSIRDPRSRRVRIPRQRSLVDVLELAYHDAEPVTNLKLPADVILMSADQAKAIWSFVERVRPRVKTLVVQCEQGMSRSPAVAAALSHALGLDVERWFEEYLPNRHVFDLMLALRE